MDSFAELIAPVSPEAFFSDHYGKAPLHIRGDRRRAELFPWARLNEILALNGYWTEETLRLWLDKRALPASQYTTVVPTLQGDRPRANPTKVQALMARGATLVANAVDTLTPELRATARMLEREFFGHASANLYCSFKGRQAFDSHYDSHEVFAVHMQGEKVWRIYEGRLDNPVDQPFPAPDIQQFHDRMKGRVMFEVLMRPGDVLYIPRGQYHDALASSEASLHVTFSVHPSSGWSLRELIRAMTLKDSLFRAYLPRPVGDEGREAVREHLRLIAERASAIITSDEFLEQVIKKQRSDRVERGEFSLPNLPPITVYEVKGRGLRVARTRDGWALTDGRSARPLRPGGHEVARWAVERSSFALQEAVAEFPFLEPEEVRQHLDALTAAGVVALRG